MVQPMIRLQELGSDFVTRYQGDIIRIKLSEVLQSIAPEDRITISLAGITTMSPSFADECFGKLLLSLGVSDFRSRVALVDADDTVRTLINVILSKRAREALSQTP